MLKAPKKYIKVLIKDDVSRKLSGSFNHIRNKLKEWEDKHSNDFKNFSLRYREGWDYQDLSLYGERLETDEEYNKRLKKEKKDRLAIEYDRNKKREYELKELARLKKKYESTTRNKIK